MSIKLNIPPRLSDLLKNPRYRQYFLTVPEPAVGQTWQVWGLKWNEKWAGKILPTYIEGVKLVKQLIKQSDTYQDVVIYSRNKLYYPPHSLADSKFPWCGRCRRPTVFVANPRHPSLRKAQIINDRYAPRCYYCGIGESLGYLRPRVLA